MYLGRQQIGTWMHVLLQCVNSDGEAAMPDAVPVIKVWSGSALILDAEMPVFDKSIQVGLFRYPIFFGELYSTGSHVMKLFYVTGGVGVSEERRFDLIAGGNDAGQVLGMIFFHRPDSNSILYQTEDGRIRRGRNPRVS